MVEDLPSRSPEADRRVYRRAVRGCVWAGGVALFVTAVTYVVVPYGKFSRYGTPAMADLGSFLMFAAWPVVIVALVRAYVCVRRVRRVVNPLPGVVVAALFVLWCCFIATFPLVVLVVSWGLAGGDTAE